MAILRHPAVEYGYGAGQDGPGDCLALCGTGGRQGFARTYLQAHHGRARQSPAGPFDTKPFSLSRSAEPLAGGIDQAQPRLVERKQDRRTRAPWHTVVDQWRGGRLAQYRLTNRGSTRDNMTGLAQLAPAFSCPFSIEQIFPI